MQAQLLFEACEAGDVADALDEARGRGPLWSKAVDVGLKNIAKP